MSAPQGASPPTFILGAPRSGTSLLYKALCLHPEAAWISNFLRRLPARCELAALNRLAARAPERRRAVWFGGDSASAYVYGGRRRPADRAFPMPVEGEPLFRHCGFPGPEGGEVRPGAVERLRASVERIQRWSGGRCFVNKRIANNQRIPQLAAAFPEARYLVITRDGRAVAASLAKVDWWPTSTVFWYGDTPRTWASAGRDPWELCAREWVEQVHSVETGLSAVPDRLIERVRFEDLVDSPRQTLRRLADFVGLARSESWDAEVGQLRFPQGDRWKTELAPPAIDMVESVQLPLLRAHGYA